MVERVLDPIRSVLGEHSGGRKAQLLSECSEGLLSFSGDKIEEASQSLTCIPADMVPAKTKPSPYGVFHGKII